MSRRRVLDAEIPSMSADHPHPAEHGPSPAEGTEVAPVRDRSRPTITDVAHKAGVSRATVSLVLNNVPGARISPATRERVRTAAKALDFHPDSVAKALSAFKGASAGRIGAIALLFTDAAHAWWGHSLLSAMRAHCPGTLVAALDCAGDSANVADYARRLRGRVDGLILVRSGPDDSPPAPELLKERIVLIGVQAAGDPVPTVLFDDYPGGRVGTQYLLAAGHRRIAVLDDGEYLGGMRVLGYNEAMAMAGLPVDPALIASLPDAQASVATVMDGLLALPNPPTAVLCPTNSCAVNVLLHLARLGVRVPDDLVVLGQGDDSLAGSLAPALSVTAPPIEALAALGIGLLLAPTPQPGRTIVPCSVISRQTG
jgi:LacI family transcriptional regulator